MSPKIVIAIVAVLFAAFLMSRYTSDEMSPLQRSVSNELQNYGVNNVDVSQISTAKLEEMKVLINSGKGTGEITGGLKAILNRP
ncbi:MAG: hypothetical protein ABJ327_16260 [Litoreibacter sp.]